MAAFGIAPSTTTEDVERRAVHEILPLPTLATEDSQEADLTLYREERIQRGDTIGSLLTRLGVTDSEAVTRLQQESPRLGLSQLRAGRTLRAVTRLDGTLLSLRYLAADGTEVIARRARDNVLEVSQNPVALQTRLTMSSGKIRSSLFQAIDDAGLDDDIAAQLAEVFSGEIDFHRDLHPGDRFSVVYETMHAGSEYIRTGKVVAAEFQNGPDRYRAFLYAESDGSDSYFTEDGKSLRRSFLRSPLEFSRITSGFSTSRFHPVLDTWRAHRGVDYGAPMGTRVRATGDGRIRLAGQMRGYGNVVVISHPNGFETLYGHLAGFGSGVRAGTRINQGDIIGFVGMTGLATGPHLHYEMRVDGVHRDPLKVIAPPSAGISPSQTSRFKEATAPLIERLDLISGIDVTMHQ